jgi:repressor LexA
MNLPLTAAQAAALEAIKGYIQQHGVAPTIREVGVILNLSSSSTVHSHFKALRRKGYISWDDGRPGRLRVLIQEAA